jgi:hypothetical protein
MEESRWVSHKGKSKKNQHISEKFFMLATTALGKYKLNNAYHLHQPVTGHIQMQPAGHRQRQTIRGNQFELGRG